MCRSPGRIPGAGFEADGRAKVRKWGNLPVADSQTAFQAGEGFSAKRKPKAFRMRICWSSGLLVVAKAVGYFEIMTEGFVKLWFS